MPILKIPNEENYEFDDSVFDIDYNVNIDLSSCADLKTFYFTKNTNWKIETLDFSKCPNIEIIYCQQRKLKSIILPYCPRLTELHLSENELTELDLSGCPNLTELFCSGNKLKYLDVACCPHLKIFHCAYNELQDNLDVSTNDDLKVLVCNENPFISPKIQYLNTEIISGNWNQRKINAQQYRQFCKENSLYKQYTLK